MAHSRQCLVADPLLRVSDTIVISRVIGDV